MEQYGSVVIDGQLESATAMHGGIYVAHNYSMTRVDDVTAGTFVAGRKALDGAGNNIVVDRLTDDEPTPEDVLWNDVEHDERCCMDGTYQSPANECPGVEELFRIEREDPSL